MKTLSITLNGIALRITGDYSPAESQTWTDPGCDASFEVYRVMDRDVDVTHLYADEQIEEIEALALEAVGDDDDYERERAADMRREDARLGWA